MVKDIAIALVERYECSLTDGNNKMYFIGIDKMAKSSDDYYVPCFASGMVARALVENYTAHEWITCTGHTSKRTYKTFTDNETVSETISEFVIDHLGSEEN